MAIAAVLTLSLKAGALYGSLGGAGELVMSSLLGALFRTGGPCVVALSALTEKGLSPGAALVGATLSSALGAKLLLTCWRTLGGRGVHRHAPRVASRGGIRAPHRDDAGCHTD